MACPIAQSPARPLRTGRHPPATTRAPRERPPLQAADDPHSTRLLPPFPVPNTSSFWGGLEAPLSTGIFIDGHVRDVTFRTCYSGGRPLELGRAAASSSIFVASVSRSLAKARSSRWASGS